ncbi:MAG: ABC transporter ATP-binding protein, partial [Kiritimatiellia bacterium]
PPQSTRNMLRHLLPWGIRPSENDFWALRDISFELGEGKVLGILGRNGSGKSTLMQIVAGLLEPSTGHISVQGNVAALLELGAGFNPEFTGRENAVFSGTIYGFGAEEIESRLDDIIEFADIGEHIDAPVKTYSSGMFARLAFSVAIAVNPTLLLVDEILSVGDLGFQARCYKRIEEMKQKGTSILFVSHDLNSMQVLCDEVLLLDRGRMIDKGNPKKVTETYRTRMVQSGSSTAGKAGKMPAAQLKNVFSNLSLKNQHGDAVLHARVGERYVAEVEFSAGIDIENPVFNFQVQTMQGVLVYDTSTLMKKRDVHRLAAGDKVHLRVQFDLHTCPGPFRLGFGVATLEGDLPRPLSGSSHLAFEAIADVPAYGFANLYSKIDLTYL